MTAGDVQVVRAIERIGDEVRGMRMALEAVLETLIAPSPEPTCDHPADSRIDFGITDNEPDWECKVCGYQTPMRARQMVTR